MNRIYMNLLFLATCVALGVLLVYGIVRKAMVDRPGLENCETVCDYLGLRHSGAQ